MLLAMNPASRHEFRKSKPVRRFTRDWKDARLRAIFPFEPLTVLRRQKIDDFRMMRNEDTLATARIYPITELEQPGLNLRQRQKVRWLIQAQRDARSHPEGKIGRAS